MSGIAVTPEELRQQLETGAVSFILDLRNEDDYKAWRIETAAHAESINIPQEDYMTEEEKYLHRLPKDRRIAVVCAHGDGSLYAAEMLRGWGYDAISLKGGMDLWSEFYESHRVSDNPLIYQIYRVARGCMTHVVIAGREAIVVDPVRHIDRILALVAGHGAVVTHIFDTHLHADHLSGGPELAEKTGATYWLHHDDAPDAPVRYRRLQDGLRIRVGTSELTVVHTPGHTPGSTSLLLDGAFLFTGDAVMKTSIGRPDLGGKADEWARMLYDTLFQRMKPLSDSIVILPAHATSLREQDEDGVVRSTMQEARAGQRLFHMDDFRSFLDTVKAELPENPEQYQEIRKVNLGLALPDENKRKELEIGKNLCGMAKQKS